jgi:hypothetical protein
MADLVAISAPNGRTYRVHPFVAEQGEWFAPDRDGLRRQLPAVTAFERDLARLAQSQPTPAPTPSGEIAVKFA